MGSPHDQSNRSKTDKDGSRQVLRSEENRRKLVADQPDQLLPLLDFGDYPRIEAASIGDLYLMQDGRSRWVLQDWFRSQGVWQRRIVGVVTIPIASLREQRQMWQKVFHGTIAPIEIRNDRPH
jgi:hypothetical protein